MPWHSKRHNHAHKHYRHPKNEQEWMQQREQWKKHWDERRNHWGLRRRLTVMFAAVALAAVALTTWMTLGAVFNAFRTLSQNPPRVEGDTPSWSQDKPWNDSAWNSPEFEAGRTAFGQVTRTAFFAALIAFFLASGAAGFVTRLLTKPLLALTDGVKRFTAGERGLQLEVPRSRDELRTLTEAFNGLVSGLERQEIWRRNMVADIAHDLRTPLSVMRSELEGMQDGVVKIDNAGLERLHGEVMLLSRLVDDLRTLSLAESGGLPLKMQTVDVQAFTQRITDSFKTKAVDASVELKLETLPFHANFDPESMMRVLSNLLENALRYASPGIVTLSAKQEGSTLKFLVSDTGPGLPKEALQQVFERFYRGDSSRTSRREGSGLGLTIAKAIVEAHNGTITASNQPEGGAAFVVRLPSSVLPNSVLPNSVTA